MTVTKDAGDLPTPALVAPHDREISDPLALATGELAEAMGALSAMNFFMKASEKGAKGSHA